MNNRKSWHDLTTAQKIGTAIMGVIQLSLLLAALYDIRKRPAEQINGSKKMWTGIAFINYVGPLAYFAFGRKWAAGCCARSEEGGTDLT